MTLGLATTATTATVASAQAPSATPSFRLPAHIPALDAFRAFAVLLVIFHNGPTPLPPHGLFETFVHWLVSFGWVGVTVFFALSGFLITGILIDTRDRKRYFSSFFARRTLRIFPLYYGMLILAFLILPRIGRGVGGEHDQLLWWLYLKNWSHSLIPYPHFWSLCVEEQFYLCWPFLVLLVSSNRKLLVTTVAFSAFALAVRIGLLSHGIAGGTVYSNTICRMDALTMGAGAAVLVRDSGATAFMRKHARTLGFSALFLFVLGLVGTHGYALYGVGTQTIGYTILGFVSAVWIVLAVVVDDGVSLSSRVLRNPLLRSVGKYSYGMYVLHVPIEGWLFEGRYKKLVAGHETYAKWLVFLVFIAILSYVAAVLSYHLFEKHFLALKRRFETVPREKSPAFQRSIESATESARETAST